MATIYRDAAFRRDRQVVQLLSVTPAEMLSPTSLEGIMHRQQDAISAITGVPSMYRSPIPSIPSLPTYIVRDIVLAQERMLLSLMMGEDTQSSIDDDKHQ